MRVIVSAGGSGGHIYPALTIINKIKEQEPNSEFLYIGTTDRMEKDIVPDLGIKYLGINMQGFNRKKKSKNIKTIWQFIKAQYLVKKEIKKFNPDLVLGFGGYVTGPVISTAKKLGYKTFIHEQNYVPGLANKYLAKYADLIAVTFKESASFFAEEKTVYTGHPRSEEARNVAKIDKKTLGFKTDKKLVLVVMGSLGSLTINKSLQTIIPKMNDQDYNLLIITGKDHYHLFSDVQVPDNVKVVPYLNNFLEVLTVTDLVVSRASAAVVLETYANNIPNVLVPSPYVADNHQYKNALNLVGNNWGIMLEEKNFNETNLKKVINEVLFDEQLYEKLVTNIKSESIVNSATLIYDLLVKLKDQS